MNTYLLTRKAAPTIRMVVAAENVLDAADHAEDYYSDSESVMERIYGTFLGNIDAYRLAVLNEWDARQLERDEAMTLIGNRLDGDSSAPRVIV